MSAMYRVTALSSIEPQLPLRVDRAPKVPSGFTRSNRGDVTVILAESWTAHQIGYTPNPTLNRGFFALYHLHPRFLGCA